ncbi:hypothetical protein [Streptomyces sp. NPDC088762]|uniref:hypothetical protein n=1 Tax=Streptomyces sp. NPDC088762 TaxID=3365891 RepID=UPI00381F8482
MSTEPYEHHGTGGSTAVPAALGLCLLSVGGWLLTTARPWQKPGHPLALGLGWTASAVLLVCGLALMTRCVRRVHTPAPEPTSPGEAPTPARPADQGCPPASTDTGAS